MNQLTARTATRRRHLFEWEDQPWLPASLRDIITDHLQSGFGSERFRTFRETIVDILEAPLRRSNANQIVDVCSGGGGPLPALLDGLSARVGKSLNAVLTDLYPNEIAFQLIEASTKGRIRGYPSSVSAFDVPKDLGNFQTLFTSFHHFRPEDAKRILADAAQKGRTIVIVEPFKRSDRWKVGVVGFLRGVLATPFVGRMTFARFLWSYPVPISAMVLSWDGVVSCLRAYEPEEMLELANDAVPTGYSWSVGRRPVPNSHARLAITYLIGEPI